MGLGAFNMITDTGHYITLDVSRWQGAIDWPRVRAESGIEHVYIRVNDGQTADGIDPMWRANAEGAAAAGFHVGGYVFNFLTVDGDVLADRTQAAVATVFGKPYTPLPVMADVEDNRPAAGLVPAATRRARVGRWIERALAVDQRLSPIYTGGWYWHGSRDSAGAAIVEPPWIGVDTWSTAGHPLFQSAYPFQTQGGLPLAGQDWLWNATGPDDFRTWGSKAMSRAPAPMGPWAAWTLWQFASIAHVPGIGGNVDVNLCDRAWADRMTSTAPGGIDTLAAAVAYARAAVGDRESPPGSNSSMSTRELDAAFPPVPLANGGTSTRSGTAWCGSFVLWCLWRGGVPIDPAGALVYNGVTVWSFYTPQDIVGWQQAGRWLPASAAPPVGAFVYYRWAGSAYLSDHVGLVVAVDGAGALSTVEGNVGPSVDAVASYGPGGQYPARDRALIVGYGLPDYQTVAPPPIANDGDDDMAQIWTIGGTLFRVVGDMALWLPGRNPDEVAIANQNIAAYGTPKDFDNRILKTVYPDLRDGGEMPSYPADWQGWRVTPDQFRQTTPLPPPTGNVGATAEQVRAVVAQELLKTAPDVAKAARDGAASAIGSAAAAIEAAAAAGAATAIDGAVITMAVTPTTATVHSG